jgi:hypothetical protein
MGIQFTTRVDGDILIITTSGFDESLTDLQNYITEVIGVSKESGVPKVLCDETDFEYRLGTLDTFKAGEFLSQHVPKLSKIALVCNPEFLSDASFYEDVVVNRGVYLRVFTDNEKATNWLNGNTASNSDVA